MVVEARFNHIAQGSQVAATVSILHPFGFGSGTTGVCQRNDRLLISSLTFKSLPPMRAGFLIMSQAFQNSIVERACQLSLGGICISVHDDGDAGVCRSICLEQMDKLLVYDNHIRITVFEDVSDVFFLEPIIDGYLSISLCNPPSTHFYYTHQR